MGKQEKAQAVGQATRTEKRKRGTRTRSNRSAGIARLAVITGAFLMPVMAAQATPLSQAHALILAHGHGHHAHDAQIARAEGITDDFRILPPPPDTLEELQQKATLPPIPNVQAIPGGGRKDINGDIAINRLEWDTFEDPKAAVEFVAYLDGLYLGSVGSFVGDRLSGKSYWTVPVAYLLPGSAYTMHLSYLSADGEFSEPVALEFPPLQPMNERANPSDGVIDMLVGLANYHDVPVAREPFTKEALDQHLSSVEPGARSVRNYIRQASRGRVDFQARVLDWETFTDPNGLPINLADDCIQPDLEGCTSLIGPEDPNYAGLGRGTGCCTRARLYPISKSQEIRDREGLEYDQFLGLVSGISGNGGGATRVDGRSIGFQLGSATGHVEDATGLIPMGTVIHELGHGLGLPHSYGSICPGPDVSRLRKDRCPVSDDPSIHRVNYDSQSAGGPNAPAYLPHSLSLYLLGWLEREEWTTIKLGDRVAKAFDLQALYRASSGLRQVRVELFKDIFYYLEYRTAEGWDAGFPSLLDQQSPEGVTIGLWVPIFESNREQTPTVQTNMQAGQAYYDPHRKFGMAVLSNNPAAGNARVAFVTREPWSLGMIDSFDQASIEEAWTKSASGDAEWYLDGGRATVFTVGPGKTSSKAIKRMLLVPKSQAPLLAWKQTFEATFAFGGEVDPAWMVASIQPGPNCANQAPLEQRIAFHEARLWGEQRALALDAYRGCEIELSFVFEKGEGSGGSGVFYRAYLDDLRFVEPNDPSFRQVDPIPVFEGFGPRASDGGPAQWEEGNGGRWVFAYDTTNPGGEPSTEDQLRRGVLRKKMQLPPFARAGEDVVLRMSWSNVGYVISEGSQASVTIKVHPAAQCPNQNRVSLDHQIDPNGFNAIQLGAVDLTDYAGCEIEVELETEVRTPAGDSGTRGETSFVGAQLIRTPTDPPSHLRPAKAPAVTMGESLLLELRHAGAQERQYEVSIDASAYTGQAPQRYTLDLAGGESSVLDLGVVNNQEGSGPIAMTVKVSEERSERVMIATSQQEALPAGVASLWLWLSSLLGLGFVGRRATR